jgi:hypothetical protein
MNDDPAQNRASTQPMATPLGRTQTLAQIQSPPSPPLQEASDNNHYCDIQIDDWGDGTQPLDEDVAMDEPQV